MDSRSLTCNCSAQLRTPCFMPVASSCTLPHPLCLLPSLLLSSRGLTGCNQATLSASVLGGGAHNGDLATQGSELKHRELGVNVVHREDGELRARAHASTQKRVRARSGTMSCAVQSKRKCTRVNEIRVSGGGSRMRRRQRARFVCKSSGTLCMQKGCRDLHNSAPRPIPLRILSTHLWEEGCTAHGSNHGVHIEGRAPCALCGVAGCAHSTCGTGSRSQQAMGLWRATKRSLGMVPIMSRSMGAMRCARRASPHLPGWSEAQASADPLPCPPCGVWGGKYGVMCRQGACASP